jgi:signal transduction histidine kinase
MYVSDFLFLPHKILLFISRLTFSQGFVIAIAFLKFCLTFPDQNKKRPWYFWLAVLTALVFAFVTLITNWAIKDYVLKSGLIVIRLGNFFGFYLLAFTFYAGGSLTVLISKIRRLKGKNKRQLQYVFIGTFLFAIYAFATDLVPQLLGVTDLSRYAAFGAIPFIVFTSYAIIKHRLMDIRLIAIKSAVYAFLVALLGSAYIFLVFSLKNYYEKFISRDAVFIIASFVVAFGFLPLRQAFEKQADKIFAKGRYNFEDLLKKIGNVLSTNLTLDSLSSELAGTISNQMKIEIMAFILKNGFQQKQGLSLTKPQIEKLFSMAQLNEALVADELEDDSLEKQLMPKLGVEVLIYFGEEDKAVGFLALSEKASGDAYTSRDLKLLEIIAPQVTISLKNIEQQQKMIESIIEERQRINQDAHDHIYNRLGALAKKAEVAIANPNQTNPTLNLLKTDLNLAVLDLKKIVSGEIAVENDMESEPLIQEDLARVCQDFINQSSIDLSCELNEKVAQKIAVKNYWHLQCILEECLNNIRKHSKASKVEVSLAGNNGHIVL